MRVAFALGGTDLGRSGLGVWVRAVLPRLARQVASHGGSVVVLGDRAELGAYRDVVDDLEHRTAPPTFGFAPASALWHLAVAASWARRAGADVLLLPAANRRAAACTPIPVVAVVHDFANFRIAGQSDPLRNAYRRFLVLGALRRATEIVAVSRSTRDDVADLLGPGSPPTRVVENGVDAERFAPRRHDDPAVLAARVRAGLPDRYLLVAARLEHPQKNHLRLLAAFAQSAACSGYGLALAGGDWGARRLIEEEIARRGLQARVRLLGFVSDADLPLLVSGAAAVAMVGLHEGFGLPALEALAAGRPVVASTTGALPEVVGDLSAPCDPMRPESIAAALDRALLDEDLRARCATEGPIRARARSWETTAAGILGACESARAHSRL